MKELLLGILVASLASNVFAGRSNETTIVDLIVKENYVEIYTEASGGCGTTDNRWHLQTTHNNFNAMFSGLLASKVSGKKVDIVGNNTYGAGEDISWAYVAR